jgi:hypothetical protein
VNILVHASNILATFAKTLPAFTPYFQDFTRQGNQWLTFENLLERNWLELRLT